MKRTRRYFGMFMIVGLLLAQTGCALLTTRTVVVAVAKVAYEKVKYDKAEKEKANNDVARNE